MWRIFVTLCSPLFRNCRYAVGLVFILFYWWWFLTSPGVIIVHWIIFLSPRRIAESFFDGPAVRADAGKEVPIFSSLFRRGRSARIDHQDSGMRCSKCKFNSVFCTTYWIGFLPLRRFLVSERNLFALIVRCKCGLFFSLFSLLS